jgi:hypothetical protein
LSTARLHEVAFIPQKFKNALITRAVTPATITPDIHLNERAAFGPRVS